MELFDIVTVYRPAFMTEEASSANLTDGVSGEFLIRSDGRNHEPGDSIWTAQSYRNFNFPDFDPISGSKDGETRCRSGVHRCFRDSSEANVDPALNRCVLANCLVDRLNRQFQAVAGLLSS